MRLPKDIISQSFTKPDIYLCEVDKEKICKLEVSNLSGSFKFNSLSEISFEVARVYNNNLTGETKVNPYYDKIEALRLIYLDEFGYFELQGPELISDGIKEYKSCTAYSLEYTLSQKYLEDFYINTGKVDSVEVLYAEENTGGKIVPVTLYNASKPGLSLLHLMLEKIYGWSIGYVDASLKTLSRTFEIDRQSIYDFLMNEICEKFNCYVEFDTINNKINLYAESLTSKFIGDGETKTFTVVPPFSQVNTVSIDGYKTTQWEYDAFTGILVLEDAPADGSHIEVIDGALTEWETDVFVGFDNLSQEVNVNYDADEIKTRLTVTYGEDKDIREINLGMPYLTDLSYYYTPDWMGQDLYDAYTAYIKKSNSKQTEYTENSEAMLELASKIDFEENRLSLEYSIATVSAETVGTYYVRGGSAPNYYYTEVSLPSDYKAGTTYYSTSTTNLNEDKVTNLFSALKKYFKKEDGWKAEFEKLESDFKFMEDPSLNDLIDALNNGKMDNENYDPTTDNAVETSLNNFLDTMWEEIGRTPLKSSYQETYKTIQTTDVDAGWSKKNDKNYGYYYPVVIILNSIDAAIAKRDAIIGNYQEQYDIKQRDNIEISNSLSMEKNFTKGQLVRLNAFIREDELHLDDIIETSQDTVADSFKIKQDAMESGKIELQKLSQPKLQFSMSMANIYALSEFEPIIDKFKLGNVIKVGLRRDYIKQARLLQVDMNFEDFSDFQVTFGELTNLRTQSDIHADLLSQAIGAGKSVAQNSSYWTRGSDQATKTDLKIQQGLLDATTRIKSLDGTQSVSIDKYGLHLEKVDPDTGDKDPHQAWFVNNNLLFSDDGFKTSRMGIGQFSVDGVGDFYGVIAEAILSGYIESSTMVGGTINIGDGAFVVHEDGSVTMNGGNGSGSGNTIAGYVTEEGVREIEKGLQDQIDGINNTKMYRVEISTADSLILSDTDQTATLKCKIYSWDKDITQDYKDYIRWVRKSMTQQAILLGTTNLITKVKLQ